MMWDGGAGWWWVFGGGFMIFLWVGLIALLVWVAMRIIRGSGNGSGGETKKDALDIAKERYAKGEISKEEFEQIKKDLK